MPQRNSFNVTIDYLSIVIKNITAPDFINYILQRRLKFFSSATGEFSIKNILSFIIVVALKYMVISLQQKIIHLD